MAKTATKPQQNKVKTAAAAPPETLRGVVTKRIYYNAENGYCVLVVEPESWEGGQPADLFDGLKATGNMPAVREGDEYEFTGNWVEHPRFGKQFKFQSSKLILPSGKAGVARYLSQITHGVGIAKATRIVEALGEDALDKIQADPAVLDSPKLSFLTEAQREEIAADLGQNSVQAELAGMLCRPGSGIGMGTVSQIMAEYGSEAVRTVKENPYLLSSELFGIGFLKADNIAHEVGIAPNSPFRVEAALDYTLREAGNEGHVFLQPNDIVRRLVGRKGLVEASGVQVPEVAKANQKIIDEGRCVREGDAVYAKGLYEAECQVAASVRRLLAGEKREVAGLDAMVEDIESRDGIEYAPEQRAAVKAALTENISIICGGPGTGKSEITRAIVDIYSQVNPYNHIYLAAPTGRASKRLAEATGMEAKTIHRLLKYMPDTGGFYHGSLRPLPSPGLILIDEISMVDIELMSSLMAAVEEGHQVILVGDADQLPSVGPGSVLRDLIACGKVPATRLKFNWRQAKGSIISRNANIICQGEVPELKNEEDFEFFETEDADQAADAIVSMVQNVALQEYSLLDWCVMVPMHKGSCGVKALNERIREIVNPADRSKPTLGDYRLGDKCLVTKNHYGLGVFNGDVGIVAGIEKGKMTVDFGGNGKDSYVEFAVEDLDILALAYAMSIHKAQGSQYPLVIMGLVTQHYMLLVRNLLYTGVTRAKDRLILVAMEQAVKKAVKNNKIEHRYSMLAERVRGA